MFPMTDVHNRANLRYDGDFDWLQEQTAHRMCHERHLIIVIITNFGIVISPQKQGVSVFKLKKKTFLCVISQ